MEEGRTDAGTGTFSLRALSLPTKVSTKDPSGVIGLDRQDPRRHRSGPSVAPGSHGMGKEVQECPRSGNAGSGGRGGARAEGRAVAGQGRGGERIGEESARPCSGSPRAKRWESLCHGKEERSRGAEPVPELSHKGRSQRG